ncbi:hypothetical protein SAMN05880501_105184 [Ureibacillus xyleni]|uniref:Molecular chaperone DnaK n=2 Tax=Ureibacillus xyleni TaxID=614648 RepID=A0A285SMZ6_9BACL|nr:hypothetical protein SAMN05880501_105184 [Ureibacillus xyleni]
METKVLTTMQVHESEIDKIVEVAVKKKLDEVLARFTHENELLFKELDKLIAKRWVFMENEKVFYDNEVVALFPDLDHYECAYINTPQLSSVPKSKLRFSKFDGEVMTLTECKVSFNKRIAFPFKKGEHSIQYKGQTTSYRMANLKSGNSLHGFDMDDDSLRSEPGVLMPIYRLNGVNSPKLNNIEVIKRWLKHSLIPKGLSAKGQKQYKRILESKYISFDGNAPILNVTTLYEDVNNGIANENFFDINLDCNEIKQSLINQSAEFPKELLADKLLYCEKSRADIEPYDEKILSDPNRGHWDLWSYTASSNEIEIKVTDGWIARDPRTDIKEDGVIGIDFGTKSTVVVHQENSDYSLPMRIGVGNFSKQIEASHYENPTVIEFINLDRFLEQYELKKGRPNTLWEDVTVSHTAFNSLMESSSENYYTILSDLKQWAGDKKRQIRLKDKAGEDIVLPSFLDLSEDNVNPIELYAYYIGLYINNQHNGIYLDYSLSFPVTYEKEVREKIIESFENGLKKSLPIAVLEDEEVMKKFRVISGASEPAAYAVCAMQEFGFEPEEDEPLFYGVFDFGGGTTDFDFGIWRAAESPKERRFDFVIEHFGAGGDKYLGGENLLELMAFEVFKQNQEVLRNAQITFTLPPECQKFAGSEVLISDSQEAKLNTKQLMEQLRPLWERHEGYESKFDKGILKVTTLFDKTGVQKPNFELDVDREALESLIKARVEKGVRNYFDALQQALNNPLAEGVEDVIILLAGNSSKADIVESLFEDYSESFKEKLGIELFVFPPLGTNQAYEMMEARGFTVERDTITRPTGKTGVAFGLVQSRKGGKIKVVDHNVVEDDEVKFKYFIGSSKRGKFKVDIDRETPYNEWLLFIDAAEEDFELYYTSLPEATNNQLDISQVLRKKCRIDSVNEDAFVYLRKVSPTIIEYVVATEEGIQNATYSSDITTLELN